MIRLLTVVGARPNFMKAAPIIHALARRPDRFGHTLVHTGQHYDRSMSGDFFDVLGMPAPDVNLDVGSGTHAQQTARVIEAVAPVLEAAAPDVVIVVGDVNSTLAAAITAKKLGLRVAHVEAGLRSRDMSMPEEINRLCVDAISDMLFTTDPIADTNLIAEGVDAKRIHFVGNVMIDTLLTHLAQAEALDYPGRCGLARGRYATLTLHRPSNVDSPERLAGIVEAVTAAAGAIPIIFPVHPRTRRALESAGLIDAQNPTAAGVRAVDPLGYLEFLSLNRSARIVFTDSGGLQEETTALGVPCVTLRENTERPITVLEGTNRLGGVTRDGILAAAAEAIAQGAAPARRPEKWDGRAAERIVEIIDRWAPQAA
ncbi:MAG TPA: UDP-N-acetylglucosamine 2-epimerase (non-hydrolyzing) [Caulobacteraceae bacterium]|jgi:UDP-N-acetylglucosamine 2-epimerase (non-hydrolysing)|nr:UDP-N-acetylglucosamine 2-epimerase (non-hydrolyzing) [Caulobacteraceae bacterium]